MLTSARPVSGLQLLKLVIAVAKSSFKELTTANTAREFSAKCSPKEINSKLTNTQDIRIGTEFRINKLSLRGGYTKVGSPYSDSKMMKDSNSYSLGMGFDFGETLINFSYKTLNSESNKQLFDSGLTDSAKLNTKQSISSLSIIFKF